MGQTQSDASTLCCSDRSDGRRRTDVRREADEHVYTEHRRTPRKHSSSGSGMYSPRSPRRNDVNASKVDSAGNSMTLSRTPVYEGMVDYSMPTPKEGCAQPVGRYSMTVASDDNLRMSPSGRRGIKDRSETSWQVLDCSPDRHCAPHEDDVYDMLCGRRSERGQGTGDLRRGNHSSSRRDAEAHLVTTRHLLPMQSPRMQSPRMQSPRMQSPRRPNGPDLYSTLGSTESPRARGVAGEPKIVPWAGADHESLLDELMEEEGGGAGWSGKTAQEAAEEKKRIMIEDKTVITCIACSGLSKWGDKTCGLCLRDLADDHALIMAAENRALSEAIAEKKEEKKELRLVRVAERKRRVSWLNEAST